MGLLAVSIDDGKPMAEGFSVFHFSKMFECLKRNPSHDGCDKQSIQCPSMETFPREVILIKAERHDTKTNENGAKKHFPFRKSSIPHYIACETVIKAAYPASQKSKYTMTGRVLPKNSNISTVS